MENNVKYAVPRGVRDILPSGMFWWNFVENEFVNVCNMFDIEEIKIPIFESAELFERGVGESTDIVTKEMFRFYNSSKDKEYALRPEGTAGVVRAYIENSLVSTSPITKLFYRGPMFRRDTPQKGC